MLFRMLVLLALSQAVVPPAGGSGQESAPLTVMTYNIRYAHTNPPDLWPDRLPVMTRLLRSYSPDVIGMQEALYPQVKDLEAALPAYDWIGLGRDGGSRGEFMAVFYRREVLEPLEYDHYWFSDTPEAIGSRSWGNNLPRMVTWVRFRDRRSGREFVVVNTHLDHQSQPSRERSAELLVERSAGWGPEVPVVLMGDFNADPKTNPVYRTITEGGRFRDTWSGGEALGTSHGFRGYEEALRRPRIDWILVRGPVNVLDAEIVSEPRTGQLPSDHYPVVARLRID